MAPPSIDEIMPALTGKAQVWSSDGRYVLCRNFGTNATGSKPEIRMPDSHQRFLEQFARFLKSHGYRLAFVPISSHHHGMFATSRPVLSPSAMKALCFSTKESQVIEHLNRTLKRQGYTLRVFRAPPPSTRPLSQIGRTSKQLSSAASLA